MSASPSNSARPARLGVNSVRLMIFWLDLIVAICVGAQDAGAEDYKPLQTMWQGTLDLANQESAWVLGIGSVITVGALALDTPLVNYFSAQNRPGSASGIGSNFWGVGWPGSLLGVGGIVYGSSRDNPHALNSGEAHLESLLANFFYTQLLKVSVRRERPDHRDRLSFPSGHTSSSFATAAVLWDREGRLAGGMGIAMGAFTGLCRMADHRHHLSDVVFGATLGWIVGHAYTIQHSEGKTGTLGKNWLMFPYYDSRKDFGIVAQFRFQ